MGLGGGTVKVKYGKDPRNTAWSNDTNRFGHQHMQKMGWEPGKGLGIGSSGQNAMTSHVKVAVKTDNTGLGKKSKKKDGVCEMDGEITTGLDTFQRLLGRLNGKSTSAIDNQMQDQRSRVVMSDPRFGMVFVHGGVLEGSVEKWLHEDKKEKKDKKDKKDKKRKRDESESGSGSESDSEDEEKWRKKEKKQRKKEKKEKKERKKEKKDKKKKEKEAPVPQYRGRLAARMKFINSKRAVTSDSKALNEILMVQA